MSTKYRVVFAAEAERALEVAYYWIEERAPERAKAWANGFMLAIDSLSEFPARCPLAPESDLFNQELRQLLYGKKGRRYRALFTIEGHQVNILFIRHYSQDRLQPPEK